MEQRKVKRHGLWQWHKALHLLTGESIFWWKGYEYLIEAKRKMEIKRYVYGKEFFEKPSITIIRCANRYFRLKKIRPSIAQWNVLTGVICDRMNANHMALKVAQITGAETPKQCTKLRYIGEFDTPTPAYLRYDIKDRLKRIVNKWAGVRCAVNEAIEESSAPWCEIPSAKDWSHEYNHCQICGAYCGSITRHNYRGKGDARTHTATENFNSYSAPGPCIHVCKNKKCRAIANYSKFVKTAKHGNKLLIGLINECTKHKGDNQVFRGLAKHLARHA